MLLDLTQPQQLVVKNLIQMFELRAPEKVQMGQIPEEQRRQTQFLQVLTPAAAVVAVAVVAKVGQ
jgi:hypothetical protein